MVARNMQWGVLRWVREFRNLTQAQVAAQIRARGGRMSDDHLSRVERGEGASLAYDTVQAWADTLGVPLSALDALRRTAMSPDQVRALAAEFVFNSLDRLSDHELDALLRERYGRR